LTAEIVVDASVAIKWLVEEPGSDWAMALHDGTPALIGPELLYAECNSALWKLRRRGFVAGEAHLDLLDRLADFDVTFVACGHALHRQALALATRLDHPAYDCLYLALALSRGAAPATADARFARVLRRDGALPAARLLTPTEPASPP